MNNEQLKKYLESRYLIKSYPLSKDSSNSNGNHSHLKRLGDLETDVIIFLGNNGYDSPENSILVNHLKMRMKPFSIARISTSTSQLMYKELVMKTKNEEDKREHKIYLTPKGKEIYQGLEKFFKEDEQLSTDAIFYNI